MARRLLNHSRPPDDPEHEATALFVTGGIGDVIALSCFLPLPPALDTIYYATRQRANVEAYLSHVSGHAPIKHVAAWDDWSDRWAFYSLPEFVRQVGRTILSDATGKSDRIIRPTDWSIGPQFARPRPFRGLPWTPGHPLSSIHDTLPGGRLALPERYAVFQPFSSDKRDRRRDFNEAELLNATAAATAHDLPLVLLNHGDDPPIDSPIVIDLQNQTNLYGSIDITLGAALYIGIDSAMSQVATKVLPAERLLIKSVNPHYYRNLHWYCAPHDDCGFVVPDARLRLWDGLVWSAE